MLKQIIPLAFVFSFALEEAHAASLEEVSFNDGDTVGVVLSTFDPITIFHEEQIENVLREARLDYLLVIPTDFTPHKLRRSTMEHRQKMLAMTFGSSPKVIVTRPYEFGFPQSRGVIHFLRHFTEADLKVVAVALYNDLYQRRLAQIVAKFLTQPDSWLIVKPSDADEAVFPKRIGKKPVSFIIGEHPKSSKIAREYLRGNDQFFNRTETPALSVLPVNPLVREYIRSEGLYYKRLPLCALPYDIVRSLTTTARLGR